MKDIAAHLVRSRTAVASLCALLIGLVLQVAANEVRSTLLDDLASTFLTLGAVGLVAEYWLRRAYTAELLSLVKLQSQLYEAGVEEVTTAEKRDWSEAYRNPRFVRVLVLRPHTWLDREWQLVLNGAKTRAVEVRVYMPDPGLVETALVATLHGLGPETYKATLSEVAAQVESAWRTARNTGSLHPSSNLTIELLDCSPAYALLQTDSVATLLLQPPTAAAGPSQLAVSLNLARSTFAKEWVEARWDEVASHVTKAPLYTDRRNEGVKQSSPNGS